MLSRLLSLTLLLFAVFGAGLMSFPSALAKDDDEKTEKKEAEDDRPLKEQWQETFARQQEILEKVKELQKELPKAEDDERKKEIQTEFLALKEEFFTEVIPKLGKIAGKVFADDPENIEAGEIAVQNAYEHNQYAQALKLADQVLELGGADRNNIVTSNIKGISLFALHDFAKAHELFKALEDEGKLHPQLGGRYLEPSEEYGDFWEAEQTIREKEEAAKGDDLLPRVLFKTNRGDIELELFENEAPNTVANFISLVEAKKYDGIKFHRVIPNFMAQGGDPNTLDDDPSNDGQGGPGYTIKCECYSKNARKHFRGSISMAHAGKDTGGSQFFLTHLPTPHLNPDAQRQTGHTVFGRVIKGMDVVDALAIGDEIESATVERKRDHDYEPKTQADKKSPPEKKK